jgi:hypothetical protein
VNTALRSRLIAAWAAAVVIVAALSVAMNASLSTTTLVVAIGLSPAIIAIVLSNGAAGPTVAEILHSVHTKDGRP